LGESISDNVFTWISYGGGINLSTGRFLTRQPGRLNPYVPWGGDPALLGPLGLLVMLRWRRRGKKDKMDMLLMLLVVGLAFGLSLAARGGWRRAAGYGYSPFDPAFFHANAADTVSLAYPAGNRNTWITDKNTHNTPTSFRFTGQRLESSFGLYFYGAR
jgi:hypothetical protein